MSFYNYLVGALVVGICLILLLIGIDALTAISAVKESYRATVVQRLHESEHDSSGHGFDSDGNVTYTTQHEDEKWQVIIDGQEGVKTLDIRANDYPAMHEGTPVIITYQHGKLLKSIWFRRVHLMEACK